MKDHYKFFMPMRVPTVTYQERRIVAAKKKGERTQFFDTDALRAARELYCAHLAQHRPVKKLEGAVRLDVIFCFEALNGHHHGEYKITKPDTDNMIKLFKDCMTKTGYWKDDNQVADEHVSKRYCEVPGVLVEVEELWDHKETYDLLSQLEESSLNDFGPEDFENEQ